MLAHLWAWFLGVFGKQQIGILFVLLFKAGVSEIAAQIANVDLQKKALRFVKDLAQDTTLTNWQKASIFNTKMVKYGKKIGLDLGEAVVNCLRELAVNALKAERGR